MKKPAKFSKLKTRKSAKTSRAKKSLIRSGLSRGAFAELTEDDYRAAAKKLGCDVAAVKAVAEVESSGHGFLSDGRIKILFEGHIFYRYTKGKFAASHPTLCFQKWTKIHYTRGANADIRGDGELKRLETAIALDRIAALMSASYGKFQIMGFNFAQCGFRTVEDMFAAVQVSEGAQLDAFCEFVKSRKMDDELRDLRWADFARMYNGASYKLNKYDEKLAKAYAKHSVAV